MTWSAAQQRWIAAGLAALTGDPDGPCLVPPTGVVERIEALGGPYVDALALLGERAALVGLVRGGQISCGGATRLLPAADGWVAISLARPDDVDLLPAWLGVDAGDGVADEDLWVEVAGAVEVRTVSDLVESGRALGLPVATPVEGRGIRRGWDPWPVSPETHRDRSPGIPAGTAGAGARASVSKDVLIVDLSSLWAGPLCSRLLADEGADVIKVESVGRPDGARQGSEAFFDRLNLGKASVALDFTDERDRDRLRQLVSAADVVIEGSRPRALRQLGIAAEDLVASHPKVWVSITGHGRDPAHELAVGFGDDAAVAGGLVAWGPDGVPRFAVDAIADPLAGMAAHRAVVDALIEGVGRVIDVPLSGVAARCAQPDVDVAWTEIDPGEVPRPNTSPSAGSARTLGEDTARVLQERGIS